MTLQPATTKLTVTPKSETTKTSVNGKKTASFIPKITNSMSMKTVTSTQKQMLTVATIYVQRDEEVVIRTEDDKVTLTDDKIGIFFKIPPVRKN